MQDVIGTTFLNNKGPCDDSSIKSSRVVCLYFCAEWCPPCQNFTPILVDFYNDINCQIKQLEIILISKDKDESSFKSFLATMPWLSIPYNDKRIDAIITQFKQESIPALYVLDKKGGCITKAARSEVLNQGSDCFVNWVQLVESKEESKEEPKE